MDPGLRAAVEAALGEAARGYLVDAAAVPGLATERGVVVTDRTDEAGARRQAGALADATIRERVVERGGGVLAEAVRRDSNGAARRLLGRAVWLPDLDACLAIQPDLPPGWVAVPRDGAAVVTDRTVRLGPAEGLLERRAEAERLTADVARLEAEAGALQAAAAAAANVATPPGRRPNAGATRRPRQPPRGDGPRTRNGSPSGITKRDSARAAGTRRRPSGSTRRPPGHARRSRSLTGPAEGGTAGVADGDEATGRGSRRSVGGTHRRIAGAA